MVLILFIASVTVFILIDYMLQKREKAKEHEKLEAKV